MTTPKTPSKFVVEIPTLGVNATAYRMQRDGITRVEFPLYAYDRKTVEPRTIALPGLDWTSDHLRTLILQMVSDYLRGVEDGRREVRDQVLRGIGLHGLRDAVDDLTDRVDKMADRLDETPTRRRGTKAPARKD